MSTGTTKRGIRIPDDLWDPARAKADQEGVHLSDVVRGLLRGWVFDGDDTTTTKQGEK